MLRETCGLSGGHFLTSLTGGRRRPGPEAPHRSAPVVYRIPSSLKYNCYNFRIFRDATGITTVGTINELSLNSMPPINHSDVKFPQTLSKHTNYD